MSDRHFIFIDATTESHAPFFAQSPLFQPWLHSYGNVQQALEYISQIRPPYDVEVYLARDNILDDVPSSDTNGPTRTLLQTLCDSTAILHVCIFCPEINTDLLNQFRKVIPNPRLIKEVLSAVNLHTYICTEGISHFNSQITRLLGTEEIHLIPNLVRIRDELMAYLKRLLDNQKQKIDDMVEAHSNKPSEESS